MIKLTIRAAAPLALALLAACGGDAPAGENEAHGHDEGEEAHAEGGREDEGVVTLTPQQIRAAGIELVRPALGGGGTLRLPATIEGDPQGTRIVSAAIGGRVVTLNYNLGQSVSRGQVVAVIESREAAAMRAEVEAAQARLDLVRSNLAREERLHAERVSPERDVIAARTAAVEAGIALRLARQQVSAAGVASGGLNRIGVTAPISGQVIGRPAVLGETVAADAELLRLADLSRVAVNVALSPADAAGVRVGAPVEIDAGGRRATGRIGFVSPVLDEATRLVPAIALIDNRAGLWRVGEPVTALLRISGEGPGSVAIPASAVQTLENRTVVFVRTPTGFVARPVTLGARGGGTVTVTDGLTGREEIAGRGSFTLKAELGKGEAEHGH